MTTAVALIICPMELSADTTMAAPDTVAGILDSMLDSIDVVVSDSAVTHDSDSSRAADTTDSLVESILTTPVATPPAIERSVDLSEDTATSHARQSQWVAVRRGLANFAPIRFVRRHWVHLVLLLVGGVVIVLSLSMLGGIREKQRFLTTTRLSIMDKEVQKACRHIERNFYEPSLTPETLCRELVTSEAFLERLFERELGMTVADFIRQVRVNRVKILLRGTPQLSMAELTEKGGFDTEQALRDAFQTISGISFDAYRDAVAANEEPETTL